MFINENALKGEIVCTISNLTSIGNHLKKEKHLPDNPVDA